MRLAPRIRLTEQQAGQYATNNNGCGIRNATNAAWWYANYRQRSGADRRDLRNDLEREWWLDIQIKAHMKHVAFERGMLERVRAGNTQRRIALPAFLERRAPPVLSVINGGRRD